MTAAISIALLIGLTAGCASTVAAQADSGRSETDASDARNVDVPEWVHLCTPSGDCEIPGDTCCPTEYARTCGTLDSNEYCVVDPQCIPSVYCYPRRVWEAGGN